MTVPLTFFTGRSLILSSTTGLALSATFQSNFPTFSSPAGKIEVLHRDGVDDIVGRYVMGLHGLLIEIDLHLQNLAAVGRRHCGACDRRELRPDEILAEIKQLHLRQLFARQRKLQDGHAGSVVAQHIRRRDARRQQLEHRLRGRGHLRQRGGNIDVFLEENLDHAVARQRLRLDVLDVGDLGGQVAFVEVDDAAGHIVGQQAVVSPDYADHRNVDVGKDVGGSKQRGADAEKCNYDGKHDECVRTSKRGEYDPHGCDPLVMPRPPRAAMQDAEHGRNEEQSRQGSYCQAADDRAAEWCVLLAALAERKCHRHHADDHGQRRHQHRPKARESGLERRRCGIEAICQAFAREAHQQYAVGSSYAHAHDGTGQCRHRKRRSRHKQHPNDAGERAGQRCDDDEWVEPGLKIDDNHQIDEHDGASESEIQLAIGVVHGADLAAHRYIGAPRHVLAGCLEDALEVARDGAEIAALNGSKNVDHGLDVVVGDHAGAWSGRYGREPAEVLRRFCIHRRDRQIDQVRNGVDAILRHLRNDRIRDAIAGIQPEIRLYLAAARKCDQQAVRGVALSEANIASERPINVDIDLRVIKNLLDAQIGDAGDKADALEQVGSIGVIGFLIVANDLNIDWRRQAEVEYLRDDVGRQERECCTRELLRQPGAQLLDEVRRRGVILLEADQSIAVLRPDCSGVLIGHVDAGKRQSDIVDDVVELFGRDGAPGLSAR